MTAFDVVHNRLFMAVDALADARVAYREHHKAQPIRQTYKMGDDPKGEALINADHAALLNVIAAFHYAEQVSSAAYNSEDSLSFLERERKLAGAPP